MPAATKMTSRIPWGVLALEFLVVLFGILTAFVVEDWQDQRAEEVLEAQYLGRLRVDLELARQVMAGNLAAIDTVEAGVRASLALLDGPRTPAAIDSLRRVIGQIATISIVLPALPTLAELKGTGALSVIRSDVRIPLGLIEQGLSFGAALHDYEQTQYQTTIEPIFIRKPIPYSRVSPRAPLVPGGPAGDLGRLWGDLEFWNVAQLKLETTLATKSFFVGFQRTIETAQEEVAIAVGAASRDG